MFYKVPEESSFFPPFTLAPLFRELRSCQCGRAEQRGPIVSAFPRTLPCIAARARDLHDGEQEAAAADSLAQPGLIIYTNCGVFVFQMYY